jgi:tRNA nucleotidyltransferase (CCA-adding enzyme)
MNIPKEVKEVINIFHQEKLEAFIVGGCVRDSLMGKKPEDWDLATNAEPEKVKTVFENKGYKTFYENDFGTVGILLISEKKRSFSDIVEVTTYRTETTYSNKRHPDKVRWAKTIEEDLSRRDFTMNAIAIKIEKLGKIKTIDPYNGVDDIKKKKIKAVGDPEVRFSEDALRIFRAIRFATTLDFEIEPLTMEAIRINASKILDISKERIRDELMKMISSKRAAEGIELLRSASVLKYIIPEIEEGYGVGQNKHHIYDCYKHNLLSLDYAAKKNFNYHVKLASLLHDVGKPRCKRGNGPDSTFYNHEIVGANMTEKILERLKFPKKDIDKIVKLVRCHLFYYNVGEVSSSSVRRLVRRVGSENIEDLLKVRMCDRIGSGVPKAEPYKLRHLKYIIDKVSQDPISVKTLKVSGSDIIESLNLKPGPKVGWILNILLNEVISDPKKNKKEELLSIAQKLNKLENKELISMNEKFKKDLDEIETKKDEMTKKKYWVA